MSTPRTVVYVARKLPGDALALLDPARYEVRGGEGRPPSREDLIAQARGAKVLVPSYLDPVTAELLAEMPTVEHVANYGVGVDHIDVAACHARGVLVTNTPDVLTDATADLAFALLLAAARRVCEGDRFVRRGDWQEASPSLLLGTDVHHKTLGIVGWGRIGQAMARRASGFDMRVVHHSPRSPSSLPLDELLATSDFVSLHCPLTPATRGLLSTARLGAMKRGAILVNTARGPIVDADALAAALASGHLAAAGLDVFPDEPRVPPSLLALENVVLTPHIGSGSVETRAAMARLVVDNIERFARGEPPLHAV